MWPKRINTLQSKKLKAKGKLRYATKSYSNPYFRKKTKFDGLEKFQRIFELKGRTIFLALIASCFVLFCFILYSPFFKIKNVTISGDGTADNGKIESAVWGQANSNFFIFLPQNNIFLFKKNRLESALKNEFAFSTLNIDKKLRNTIKIYYVEKKAAIIWKEDEKYFNADENGSIIREINVLDIKQGEFPLIKNDSNSKISNGNANIDPARIKFAIELFTKIKKYESEFKADSFRLDNNINTVKTVLVNGPELSLNIHEDIDKQLEKVIAIKNNSLKDSFKNKIYIDVSVGDAVYIR